MSRYSSSYEDVVVEKSVDLAYESRLEVTLKNMASCHQQILEIREEKSDACKATILTEEDALDA